MRADTGEVPYGFHPAVAEWFRRRYPGGPTEAQAAGWAAIASGADTLIVAPTGSGKTLAAFLVAIHRRYRAANSGKSVAGLTSSTLTLAGPHSRRE